MFYGKKIKIILEVVILNIEEGLSEEFEAHLKKAEIIISSMKEYLSHQLKKGVEKEEKHILLVN